MLTHLRTKERGMKEEEEVSFHQRYLLMVLQSHDGRSNELSVRTTEKIGTGNVKNNNT